MLLNKLWRYLRGYVEVRCDGGLFNRFFDMAMNAGLGIFKVKVSGNTARFGIFIKDYAALRKLAKKSQCRVRVVKKRGLYFAYKKINNKTALIAGLLVFCTVIYLFGSMVFTIEITGSSTIPKNQLIESLARNGLHVGMMRADVDSTAVELGVLLENDRLSWVAVNMSFGVATVEVKDKISEPNDISNGRQIVAKRDAQVKAMVITSGDALVKIGDVVQKGQVLVQPTEMSAGGSWTQGVQASVMGYTEYTHSFTLSKNHVFRTETGNTIENRVLIVGGAEIPISFIRNNYQYFDVRTYEVPVWLFSVELPVRMRITEYIEINQTEKFLNETEAQALFAEYKQGFERQELAGCEILYCDVTIQDAGSEYVFFVKYLCYEDIGEVIY